MSRPFQPGELAWPSGHGRPAYESPGLATATGIASRPFCLKMAPHLVLAVLGPDGTSRAWRAMLLAPGGTLRWAATQFLARDDEWLE